MTKKIAIIGGGISGLAAAHYLQEKNKDCEISLFEASPRLGGVIETKIHQGIVLEAGPDCFLSKKTWARDLCKEVGLSQELISTREGFRRAFIYSKHKMHAIPAGFYLMAPGKLSILLQISLLSLWGKIRAGFDWFLPSKSGEEDESLASFMKRRFGRELFERLGQPMIGGIYGGDPETLSLQATVPQFREMEKKYGSVIRGLGKQQDEAQERASGPRYSLFLSLKQGMEQMVSALVKELNKVKIHTACGIKSLEKKNQGWELQSNEGRKFEVDAVFMALPAPVAAKILQTVSAELASQLQSIPYESVATVNLLYRKNEIPASFNGTGFVVPKVEGTKLSACTYASQKFEGRESEEYALLRAFVGGALYRESFDLDDGSMETMVKEELQKILGIKARPLFVSIHRYPQAMPQYHVGHLEKVSAIQNHLTQFSGLFLAGNAFEGIGIPDCIAQAHKQAANLTFYLQRES